MLPTMIHFFHETLRNSCIFSLKKLSCFIHRLSFSKNVYCHHNINHEYFVPQCIVVEHCLWLFFKTGYVKHKDRYSSTHFSILWVYQGWLCVLELCLLLSIIDSLLPPIYFKGLEKTALKSTANKHILSSIW